MDTKEKPIIGFTLVSLVSFVVTQRRYEIGKAR